MVDSEYCKKWAIFTLSVIPNRISAKILNSGVSSLPVPGIMAFSGFKNYNARVNGTFKKGRLTVSEKSALKSATKFGNKLRIALSKLL